MLFGIITVLSGLAAVLLCAGTGAFESLVWLWLLPVGFAGGFLLLAALWFGMLLIMAKCVPMDKEQEKDSPFYRTVITLTISALLPILKIHIHAQGLENTPKDGRFLLVCNHLHDTDPVVLLWKFKHSQLAFISKREVNSMFLVGPIMRKILSQPINRENDREALKTILNCIRVIKEDKASIAVFPEGYIRPDRLLRPFRSGVFKIAQKAQVPIVVCTLRGTQHIYNNMKRWKPTHVQLHLVGVVPAEELTGVTTVEIAKRVHAMMAQDLGPELVFAGQDEENT